MRRLSLALSLLSLSLAGCKSDKSEPSKNAPVKKDPNPVVIEKPAVKVHSSGLERFKEPVVYLDGTLISVLKFGELPIPLKPVWFEEEASLPFNAGDPGPHTVMVKQRRYRFKDYIAALGVDVSKITEMHMYGGNRKAAAVIIPGKDLLKYDEFLFRFGGAIWGKPLPACPAGIGDGKCPDQIGAISLYIEKAPPTRKGGYFYFGDKKVEGIPYVDGNPARGGVRVYLDGPLTAIVKRNKLKAGNIKPVNGEENTYNLFEFLTSQGVDTDTVQEAWLIAYEKRVEKLTRKELLSATFSAGKEGSGEILVGDTPTHSISLHTKPVPEADLPVILKEELEKADG